MANLNIALLPQGGMPVRIIFNLYSIQITRNNAVMALPAQLFRELAANDYATGMVFLDLYYDFTGRRGFFLQDEDPNRVLVAPIDLFRGDDLIADGAELPRLHPRAQYLPPYIPAQFAQVPIDQAADVPAAGAQGMAFNNHGQGIAQLDGDFNPDLGGYHGAYQALLHDYIARHAPHRLAEVAPPVNHLLMEYIAQHAPHRFAEVVPPGNHLLMDYVARNAPHRLAEGAAPVNDHNGNGVVQANIEVRGPADPDVANREAGARAPGLLNNVRIPRPPNAFIGFRKDHHEEVKAANPGIHNNDISKIIGAMWHNASAEVRARYFRKAEAAKAEHERLHPDYKYKPRKSAEKKRRMTNKKRAAALAVAEASHAEALAREVELQNEIDNLPNGVHNAVDFVLDDGSRMYLQPQLTFGVEPAFAPQYNNAFYNQYAGLPEPEFMAMLVQGYQYEANFEGQIDGRVMEDANALEPQQGLWEN